jgi:hypothetical protein
MMTIESVDWSTVWAGLPTVPRRFSIVLLGIADNGDNGAGFSVLAFRQKLKR